jgi:hypothetical protein
MVRKYEILGQIPEALAAIDRDIHKARRYRAGDPSREGLVLAAAETAYDTLVGLTQDALLWMALQRQVLVKGWRFQDLGQLDQLTVPATAELLVRLRVGRKQQAEILLREAIDAETPSAKDSIKRARAKLDQVKRAAVQAAAADDLTAPSPEDLLVDHAHIEATNVREDLDALIRAWKAEQDHDADVQKREARLQKILKRCGTAVGVIAFLTAAALQIPEVQQAVVHVVADLTQVAGQLAESIRVRIDALGAVQAQPNALEAIRSQIGALGVVAATSIASKPGEGFTLIDPEPSPYDPRPNRDPGSVASLDDHQPIDDQNAGQQEASRTTPYKRAAQEPDQTGTTTQQVSGPERFRAGLKDAMNKPSAEKEEDQDGTALTTTRNALRPKRPVDPGRSVDGP